MEMKADYHTHSIYSKRIHAKHTIAQLAEQAEKLGLTEIAITDHGPKHLLFGINPKKIEKAKQEVEQANNNANVKVYLGVEANIVGQDGTIDISDEDIQKLDILLMGYHKGTKCDFIRYFFNSKRNSAEQIEKNTQAYINAINKYNIAIITHLNEYIKVDVKRVAEACAKKGTFIELNRRHLKLTKEDAAALVESGVNLVLSSDAHKKSNVGKYGDCIKFIEENNIPLERVKNLHGPIEFLKP